MLNELLIKLRSAKVEMVPFPHLKISNFLPDYLYKGLIESYPSYEEFFADAKTSSQGRKIIERDVDINKFKKLFQYAPWKTLESIIEDERFTNVLFDVFYDAFSHTKCKYKRGEPYYNQFDVSVAGTGYQRGPHLDRRNHLINNFFYLNSNYNIDGFGGDLQLLRPKDGNLLKTPDKFPAAEDMEVVKVIPTEANSFVSFLPCSYSWHSVSKLQVNKKDAYRKFIYHAVNAASLADAWPETYILSEERHQAFINE